MAKLIFDFFSDISLILTYRLTIHVAKTIFVSLVFFHGKKRLFPPTSKNVPTLS